ncbi:hypothetical protein GCM10010441_41360 [Kitasatospora paracochleata]
MQLDMDGLAVSLSNRYSVNPLPSVTTVPSEVVVVVISAGLPLFGVDGVPVDGEEGAAGALLAGGLEGWPVGDEPDEPHAATRAVAARPEATARARRLFLGMAGSPRTWAAVAWGAFRLPGWRERPFPLGYGPDGRSVQGAADFLRNSAAAGAVDASDRACEGQVEAVSTVELTKDNFDDVVEGPDGKEFVLIDFWAAWCGPCRSFAPVFERASEKHQDLTFAKVDTEAQQELAAAFEIRSIPTLAIIREGVLVFAQPGALPEQALDDLISQARALDMTEVHAKVAAQKAAG